MPSPSSIEVIGAKTLAALESAYKTFREKKPEGGEWFTAVQYARAQTPPMSIRGARDRLTGMADAGMVEVYYGHDSRGHTLRWFRVKKPG